MSYDRDYYLRNRVRILEQCKAYRVAHADSIKIRLDRNKAERSREHREWRSINAQHVAEYEAEYRRQHRQDLVGKRREYCHQHPDRAALTCRQWYQQNGEKKRAYARRHRQQHPGVYRAWVERNRELIRQHARQRYHADPSKSAAKAHERRARLRMTDGTFTPEQWQAVLLFYGDRCLCCGTKGRMTIDHIIPLIIGGRNVIDNIQPLCRSCNARKHDKAIDYRPRPMPEVPVADALRRV